VWSATTGLAAPGEVGPAGTRELQAALEEALRAEDPTVSRAGAASTSTPPTTGKTYP